MRFVKKAAAILTPMRGVAALPVLLLGGVIVYVAFNVVAASGSDPDPDGTSEFQALQLFEEGRGIFRFDTFGDEVVWTDKLRLHEVIEGTARLYGAKVNFVYKRDYPITRNHEAQTAFATEVAREVVGRERVVHGGMAQGARDPDRRKAVVRTEEALETDDSVKLEEGEGCRGVVKVDLTGLERVLDLRR